MRRSQWLILTMAMAISSAADGAPKPVAVTVRVYDVLEDASLGAALAHANAAMSGVAVFPEWVRCIGTAATSPSRCAAPLLRGELAVRIVDGPRPARGNEVALGNSIIAHDHATGTLATVYADRVLALARLSRTDPMVLLGRAIAHELGHLLMGTTRHDSEGLMRQTWTTSELARGDPRDWSFAPGDAAAIRRRASRDEAPRLAQSLRRSPSSSSAADGSGAGSSGRPLPR
jgi:hypothetical protein